MLLVYTAVAATGILISQVRSAFAPSPTNKLEFDISQIKETVDKLNSNSASQEGQLTQEIKNLKSQIAQSGTPQNIPQDHSVGSPMEDVLGKSTPLGYVKVAEDFENLDIYEDTSFSSPVAGKLDPEKIYPYTKKQNNWLLIQLDNKEGWVNSKLVTETKSSP